MFAADQIDWTPKQQSRLVSPRRFDGPSADPQELTPPDQGWTVVRRAARFRKEFRQEVLRGSEALRPAVDEAMARLDAKETPGGLASIDVEALTLKLLLVDCWSSDEQLEALQAGADRICADGLELAVWTAIRVGELGVQSGYKSNGNLFIRWADRELPVDPERRYGVVAGVFEPWIRLRSRLAAAASDEWTAARDLAADLRRETTREARIITAFLFPEHPEWANEELRAAGKKIDKNIAVFLAASSTDAALAARALPKSPQFWRESGTTPWLLAALRSNGPGLLPFVAEFLGDANRTQSRLIVDHLARIRHAGVFVALCTGKDAHAAKVLRRTVDASPDLALPALTHVAAGGLAGADVARRLLSDLLTKDSSLVEHEALSKSQRELLRKLLDESTERRSDAAPTTDLPSVLVDPPWLKKGGRFRAPSAETTRAPFPDSLFWREGEREAWLQSSPSFPLGKARRQVAEKGDDAFSSTFQLVKRQPHLLPALAPFRRRILASLVVESLGKKNARGSALMMLRRHPRAMLSGLFPRLMEKGKPQKLAIEAVRVIARVLDRDEMLRIASSASDGTREWIEAILAFDPLDLAPRKKDDQPPAFWQPAKWRRPEVLVAETVKPLSDDAMRHLATMLSFTDFDLPYQGLLDVREACTADSLAGFAWDLLKAWEADGAPAESAWALQATGLFGDETSARRLAEQIRKWSTDQGTYARASKGLDALARMNNDAATVQLDQLARSAKSKPFRARAQLKLEEIAEERGLSLLELDDRLTPTFGLDPDGSLELNCGARRFRVVFDEQLLPVLLDENGAVRKSLPNPPSKKDDPDLVAAAAKRFKGLKKDVKTVAEVQMRRLAEAMVRRRRWKSDEFRKYLVEHPLLFHLTRRLLWGVYTEGDVFSEGFRVAEDRSFADLEEKAYTLPGAARIGVVHALELTQELSAAWMEIFSDYEILQPFPQIGRETYALTEEEQTAVKLTRWGGREVPIGPVLRLDKQGWTRTEPGGRGMIHAYERQVFLRDGTVRKAVVYFDPGFLVYDPARYETQTVRDVVLRNANETDVMRDRFDLDPISASELIRAIEALAP